MSSLQCRLSIGLMLRCVIFPLGSLAQRVLSLPMQSLLPSFPPSVCPSVLVTLMTALRHRVLIFRLTLGGERTLLNLVNFASHYIRPKKKVFDSGYAGGRIFSPGPKKTYIFFHCFIDTFCISNDKYHVFLLRPVCRLIKSHTQVRTLGHGR